MGITSELFRATHEEVVQIFRGWTLPSPSMNTADVVPTEVRNPFTGEILRFREPEPFDEDAVRDPELGNLPRLDMVGMWPDHLETLGEVLLGWPVDSGQVMYRAFSGPEDERSFFSVPEALTRALAELAVPERATKAKQWTERESQRLDRRGSTWEARNVSDG